jgi:outer membrane protein assembly factor BamB
MTRIYFRTGSFLFVGMILAVTAAPAGDWPQWRGPSGDSVSTETGLPVKWDERTGIVWQAALPGDGASTPAIFGNSLFLTGMSGEKLLLFKLDKRDGKVEWTREVGSGTMRRGSPKRQEHTFHNLHNLASPSPVTDGERVIVHFGNGDLAAYDFAGKQLWLHNLQKEHGAYSIWWGHANSPVLWKDLVISVCMQDSLADLQKEPAPSYLVAHDKRTGEQKWKVQRMTGSKGEDGDSYTTPLLHEVGGKTEMIVVGANQVDAYDPATGKQLWVLPDVRGSRTITGPTLGHGLLFTAEGKKGDLLAIRLGGTGTLDAKAIAWRQTQAMPDTPCPVLWKDLLFLVSDDGIAQALDAKTGQLKWKERLPGTFKASPLAADGKVYFLNLAGVCTVVAAAEKFEKLAENKLEENPSASPAVSDGCLFLRGKKSLYCISAKGK